MSDPEATEAPAEGRIVTQTRGRVRLIGIDRPRKLNGFTPEMFGQLSAAYRDYQEDDGVWCALLHSTSKHFTAGLQLDRFEITEAFTGTGDFDPLGLSEPRVSKPIVTAVSGICFTIGIELMLATDVVIAGDDTRFGQIEVKRGLMPFGGATIRMVQRAGWGNAMRWLLTGDEFDAAEALRIGFVQSVVPAGEVFEAGLAMAERIAAAAPIATHETKRSSRIFVDQGPDAAVEAFSDQLRRVAESDDFAEGVRSFIERRDGEWSGR
jgi:enoyl-CoA hydratase/carnithine racemase